MQTHCIGLVIYDWKCFLFMNSFLHCSLDSAEVCIFCVQPGAEELDGSLQNSENVFIFGCCVGG